MKRNLSIILCFALLVAAIFTLAACKSECEHEYTSAETTPATCSAEGVKTFTCVKEGCGHSYTEPIAPIPHTEEVVEAVPVTCTSDGAKAGKKCSVCGTVTLAGEVIKSEGHKYENQRCTVCGEFHPDANLTIYTFDANTMTAGTIEGGDGATVSAGTDDFFTIIMKSGAKVETAKDVEYSDGYVANQRFSIGGKINWVKDSEQVWYVDKTAIEFSTESEALIRIWWMSGKPSGYENGAQTDRYIAVQSTEGGKYDVIGQADPGLVNEPNYNEFTVDAGSYYIGNWGGNNYLFKIEVIIVND